jgi:hypothetical protein
VKSEVTRRRPAVGLAVSVILTGFLQFQLRQDIASVWMTRHASTSPYHSIDRNFCPGFVENTQSPDFMITIIGRLHKFEEKCARFPVAAWRAVSFDTSQPTGALYSYCNFHEGSELVVTSRKNP